MSTPPLSAAANPFLQEALAYLSRNEVLPSYLKEHLFPTTNAEAELTYAGKLRREDLLANQDGVFPVPLQLDKQFGDCDSGAWRNMLVWGDNLAFLKMLYEDKHRAIKGKVRGHVDLIYIDPPFATEEDFATRKGQIAYSDKKSGAAFLEDLRRRLLVAKELLSPTGSILVHLDHHKGHYAKVVLDEIFGAANFRNEIVWAYKSGGVAKSSFARKHDVIFWYSKSETYTFNPQKERNKSTVEGKEVFADEKGEYVWHTLPGPKKPKGVKNYLDGYVTDVWDIPIINTQAKERTGYPTQKPEALLERIIRACTNPGDLVMDFFAGGGTTPAVAEKLGRRWIACDFGKLSFYTIQQRLLGLAGSKSLGRDGSFDAEARPFATYHIGAYDISKIFPTTAAPEEIAKYKEYVCGLFEIDQSDEKIGPITDFVGRRYDGFPAVVFPFWQVKNARVDPDYLESLSRKLRGRAGSHVYVIAPRTYMEFFNPDEEVGGVKYTFLAVPYEELPGLHKKPFKRGLQSRSSASLNEIENVVGFNFVDEPEVVIKPKWDKSHLSIEITSFNTTDRGARKNNGPAGFADLALVLIDTGTSKASGFYLDKFYFAAQLEKESWQINLDRALCGDTVTLIFVDVFGNETRRALEQK